MGLTCITRQMQCQMFIHSHVSVRSDEAALIRKVTGLGLGYIGRKVEAFFIYTVLNNFSMVEVQILVFDWV